jgi:hypothetical protein
VYKNMEWWTKIRLEVLRGDTGKREILRREGIHWETLKKILQHPEPPGYRMTQSRPKPKIGPLLDTIAQIIESDKALPKKQRHTAKRIFERIKERGYQERRCVRSGAVNRKYSCRLFINQVKLRLILDMHWQRLPVY